MRAIIPVALMCTIVSVAGCSSSDGTFDGTVEVDDNYFEPTEATVAAGTTVTLQMEGGAARSHTVTIHKVGNPATMMMHNHTMGPSGMTEYTFATAGTCHVWCRFHGSMTSGMRMLVTVE